MGESTKVWVHLPDRLLAQLDHVARESGISRDDALCRAVESFVGRALVGRLEEAMAEGYQAMAELNLSLVEEDSEALADWPVFDASQSEAGRSGDS